MSATQDPPRPDVEDDDLEALEDDQPGWIKITTMLVAVAALVVAVVLSFPSLHGLLGPDKPKLMTWSGGTFPVAKTATVPTYQAHLPSSRPDYTKLATAFDIVGLKKVSNASVDGTTPDPNITGEVSYKNAHDGEIQIYDSHGITSIYVAHAARPSTDAKISKATAMKEARSIYTAAGLDLSDYVLSTSVTKGLLYIHAQQKIGSGRSAGLSAGSLGGYVYFDKQGPRGMKFGIATLTEGKPLAPVTSKQAWDAVVKATTAAAPWVGTYVRATLVWTVTTPEGYSAKNQHTALYVLVPAWQFSTADGVVLLVDANPQHVGTVL